MKIWLSAALIGIPQLGAGALLYDVDFSSPLHRVGSPPTILDDGFPRRTPSNMRFGNPVVVSSYGSLTTQPLHFDGPGNVRVSLEQIGFDINAGADRYLLELDLLIQPMPFQSAHFAILVDAPLSHSVKFSGDRTIEVRSPDGARVVGAYDYDAVMHVSMLADPILGEWAFELGGELLHRGSIVRSGGDVRSFRLSTFFGTTNALLGTAAVDNVSITTLPAAVPEPKAMQALIGAVLAGVAARRWTKPRSDSSRRSPLRPPTPQGQFQGQQARPITANEGQDRFGPGRENSGR